MENVKHAAGPWQAGPLPEEDGALIVVDEVGNPERCSYCEYIGSMAKAFQVPGPGTLDLQNATYYWGTKEVTLCPSCIENKLREMIFSSPTHIVSHVFMRPAKS